MPTETHPFQKWINDNKVKDVRFYPQNPSATSPSKLMDDAYAAVIAHEEGNSVPYIDETEHQDSETILAELS